MPVGVALSAGLDSGLGNHVERRLIGVDGVVGAGLGPGAGGRGGWLTGFGRGCLRFGLRLVWARTECRWRGVTQGWDSICM